MSIHESLAYHSGLARALGVRAAVSIGLRRRFGLRRPMRVRWQGQVITLRPRESDPVVASAVLGRDEYSLGELGNAALARLASNWHANGQTPVIIDGGANVGYASLYFARCFPEATIIAVEPNPETFEVLRANCANHPQIRPVLGALWSHGKGVFLRSEPGDSWSDSVSDGGDTPSYLMQDLLASVSGGVPFIIKLDIEGAEHEVCKSAPELLRQAACLLIEPHDYKLPGTSCLSPLYDAMHGRKIDTLLVGEYLAMISSDLLKEGAAAPAEATRNASDDLKVA